jgi:RHH-type proline utilization regulon transcriptional repressor/proline dehydrogenase/delta 1-pyrroline-5-carboxylate dehydrogenase
MARPAVTELPAFHNEPVPDIRSAVHREERLAGLAWLDEQLPMRAPSLIGDEAHEGDAILSTDPADPERAVATAPRSGPAEVDAAVTMAQRGYRIWSAVPARERALVLSRAAAWMRGNRLTLAACCVREAGKPWAEADAEISEAIDFLEFYARGAVALDHGRPLFQAPGERNGMHYVPRGIVAVLSPFNLPLAMPAGLVGAALATGNSVVLKPAEQTPLCGSMLVQALRACGVPPEALGLVQGDGRAGAALVRDSRVATVAFTGSVPIGLDVLRAAADVVPGQRQLKRAIVEMGGKNCVIVDEGADVGGAVEAIVRSAFDYAGQKCSAASRLLVHDAVADALIERLADAVGALRVGPPEAFDTQVGPVIDQTAQERVAHYAEQAAAAGRVAAHRVPEHRPARGWYCPPIVVSELDPATPVLREEVFGPLLTVERVASIADACDRVDALPFALTGGLFTRNADTARHVFARTPVGNLYVNRATTGAMVGRQPFGGNRLSGSGSRAGGPDYLLHFVEPLVVTESIVQDTARA